MNGFRLTVYPVMDINMDASKNFEFSTHEEMMAAKNAIADMLLYLQDDLEVMNDFSNMFVLEQNCDGDWEEIDEDDN